MQGLPTRRRIPPATRKRSRFTSASRPGARCAKSTAPTARRGNISPTSTRAHAVGEGARNPRRTSSPLPQDLGFRYTQAGEATKEKRQKLPIFLADPLDIGLP